MRTRVSIVTPSSVLSRAELELGVKRLIASGLQVKIHPHVFKKYLLFPGTDETRARAFYDEASSPECEILWCGRGGYGAARLLPILDALTQERGAPAPKVLVGYSDMTALMAFVTRRWGWHVLHAPMPGLRSFFKIPEPAFQSIVRFARGEHAVAPWSHAKLKWVGATPLSPIEASMIGGNLAVYVANLGTPYTAQSNGKILFLEDTTEPLYRVDRLMQQLVLAGGLDGVRALVLGTFSDVYDSVSQGLKNVPSERTLARVMRSPKPSELAPLRKSLTLTQGLRKLLAKTAANYGVPTVMGLPVGHDSVGHQPLPLGPDTRYRLLPGGKIELLEWGGFTE